MTRWVLIDGFKNYEVSDDGRVRSIGGRYGCSNCPKELKQQLRLEYARVGVRKDGKAHHLSVHCLVAKAFIPNPFEYPEINHKDGIKNNNHYENLEWVTKKQNMEHAVNILKAQFGALAEKNGRTKLTREQVKQIKLAEGYQKDIAKRFGITQAYVGKIKNNKNWVSIS